MENLSFFPVNQTNPNPIYTLLYTIKIAFVLNNRSNNNRKALRKNFPFGVEIKTISNRINIRRIVIYRCARSLKRVREAEGVTQNIKTVITHLLRRS
jgi:hypothetical protein